MAGGPEITGTMAAPEILPPSYEDTHVTPLPRMCPQEPVPATSGKSYRNYEHRLSVSFGFCPNPADWSLNQTWVAVLLVKCPDVPRLMREGFHWGRANVMREEGYMDQDFTYARCRQDNQRWAGTRHYFLKDTEQPLRWMAAIAVFALHVETLYQFDLNRISTKRCSGQELVISLDTAYIIGYTIFLAYDTI
ncbi:hypothetical protein CIB48_g1209 [Xylaria polymorpha]|nr:hypothetical protein CIB48_g1209 [Xylaria polymorpha]